MASKKQPLTLLVVPARYAALQVSFDLASRFPVVLLSYQKDIETGDLLLHAWDGNDWVYVAMPGYEKARFVQYVPKRAILVGDDHTLPPNLAEATSWCPEVLNIPDVKTDALVNSLGRIFDFSPSDWQWFASRYKLQLRDQNAERRLHSWYDGPARQSNSTPAPVDNAPMTAPLYEPAAEEISLDDLLPETE